jgi:ribosomal protein L11 methylase PrmA
MEDFGLAFYVEAMDNEEQKTLYLWGQYLDALAYEAAFPNTHFSITWRSDAKDWVIDTQMYGSYFEAEKILPAFDHRTPWEELPKNGDILDVALDQIV